MKSMNKLCLSIVALGSLACAGIAGATPGPDAATPEQRSEHRAERLQRRAEFEQRRADLIARFDTNKDGKLDDAERAVMRDTLAQERFAQLDTNHDGMLSLAEFKAGHKRFAGDHHARRWSHGRDRK